MNRTKVFTFKVSVLQLEDTISVNRETSGTADSYNENKQDNVIKMGCYFSLGDQEKPT